MTEKQSLFLKILKSAVTGEPTELPQDIDYDFLIETAKRHRVENALYCGLLNCGCKDFADNYPSFNNEVMRNIYYDQKQSFLLKLICENFRDNGICFAILKGPRMKDLYPRSDMRAMSDLDVLIKIGQYDKIKPLLIKLGFTESEESIHEIIWYFQDLKVEFHKQLIPSNNIDYFAFFGDGWDIVKPKAESSFEYEMSKNDEFLFLFTHIAKHFRDSGIGVRYLIDIWLYMRAYELDRGYIEKNLEELRLLKFYRNILDTAEVWFGGKEATELTDYITDYIFNCRVRGTFENRVLSTGLLAKKYGGVISGRNLTFLRLVFPDFRRMTVKYPVLKKAPVLLPFCYVARWFEAIFLRRGIISAHRNDIKMQTDENISRYEDNLRYMGIEYHLDDE